MRHRIDHGPAYAMAVLSLDPGESVTTEAGAMVTMSPGLEIKTDTGAGGLLKGLKRATLGGESFFMNTYVANEAGEIGVAPALPGDITIQSIGAETIFLTSGSFLAASAGVDIDTKWGGAKTFFSREGLFLLKVTGPGDVVVSSYGAIVELSLEAGTSHIVDTGHMVGFTDGVGYNVRKFGGWKSTILGGEGLVVELTGPGKAWIQTRSPDAFVEWLVPQLPKQSGSS